ncbi:ATP-binding cassette domain-containing protein [Microbacterium lacticum]
MTASLPLPPDDDGDDVGDDARAPGSSAPPVPRLSAADAAAQPVSTARPAAPRAPRKKPTKSAPRPATGSGKPAAGAGKSAAEAGKLVGAGGATGSAGAKKPRTPARKRPATADAPPPPATPAAVAAARFADTDDVHAVATPGPDAQAALTSEDAPDLLPSVDAEATLGPVTEAPPPPPQDEPVVEPDPEPAVEAVLEPVVEAQPTVEPELAVEAEPPVEGAALEIERALEDEPDDAGLRLRGVTKSFGQTRAVDRIDLTVPAGTFYGIVGPNGAGKTTTLSMIAGLLRPDEGMIEIAGIDLGTDPARAKRQMGILPDRLRTFDRLTGRQLLHYYGVLRGLRSSVVESRTADLARAFDLTDALGRTVSDYSTGMTKKVMLAGAMIHSPRVLVLDEPFESVDPVSSAVILDILAAYVDHGGTVILSSHGMELVERVCSGVAVIVAGQVLAQGTVDAVRGDLTLEERFIQLAGGIGDGEGLEWLHTFSD